MEPQDLVKVWDAPDNSKLTPKQLSIRLPIHVAAKISALCDMYPRKTKTEIIGDLLATALDQLRKGFPYVDGRLIGIHPDTHEELFEDIGPRSDFDTLTQKYLSELEKELDSK
jgi:hypothetical protein